MNLQYFLYRMLPNAWQVGFAPNVSVNWRYVDVAKALQGAKAIKTISIDNPADYQDITATGK